MQIKSFIVLCAFWIVVGGLLGAGVADYYHTSNRSASVQLGTSVDAGKDLRNTIADLEKQRSILAERVTELTADNRQLQDNNRRTSEIIAGIADTIRVSQTELDECIQKAGSVAEQLRIIVAAFKEIATRVRDMENSSR